MSEHRANMPFQQMELPSSVQDSFSPQERRIWSLCNGERAVSAIATGVGMPADVIEHILTVWTKQGWIGWYDAQDADVQELEVFDVEILDDGDDQNPVVSVVTPSAPPLPPAGHRSPAAPPPSTAITVPPANSSITASPASELIAAPSSNSSVAAPPSHMSNVSVTPPSSSMSIAAFQSVSERRATRTAPSTVVSATAPTARATQPPTAGVRAITTTGERQQASRPPNTSVPPSAPTFSPGFMAVVQTGTKAEQTGTKAEAVPPLKIPGAASGSVTLAGTDLTARIPGASSMFAHNDQATELHVVGQGTGIGQNFATHRHSHPIQTSGGLAAALVENRGAYVPPHTEPESMPSSARPQRGSSRPIREERMDISKEERDVYEEAVWEAAHQDVQEGRNKVIVAREVVTSLSRVIRTLQLYDVNNTAVRDALTTLFKQLMSFMHEFDNMVLVVEPWVMNLDGQAVYTNEDRDYNLAFKLYRDGVRGLQLHRGVNWEELAQFLKILGARYSGAMAFEDDISTMFRKANLRFISIVAIEGFGFERYEDGGKANIEKLFDRMEKYDPSEIWERPDNPDDPIRLRGGARGAVLSPAIREENAQGVLRELKSRPVEANPIAETVKTPLLHENQSEFLSEYTVRLFRYIDKVVLDLSTVTGLDGIRHLLREYRNFLMADGHPDGLKEFLSRVDRWTKLVDSRGRLLASLAQEIIDSFDDEELVRRWITSPHLSDESGLFYPSVFNILQWEGRDRRHVLLKILAQEKAPRLKETIRHLLVQMSGSDISLYVQSLREASGALALELIDCLHQIGTIEAIEVIGSMIEDADPLVQDKVISLAEQLFDGPENFVAIRGVMEYLLASEQEDERMRAYRLIEAAEDRRWLSILRKELQSKRERSDQEIIELARLVARLDPKAILPSLLEWAEPPGMLSIERQWRKQQRLGAVAALGQIGGREAEKVVRDLLEQADGILHTTCLEAMREMRRNHGVDSKQLPKRLQGHKDKIDLTMLEAHTAADTHKTTADPAQSPEDQELHRLHDMMAKSLQHIDLKSENEFASLIRECGHQWILSFHTLIKNRGLYDANNEIFIRPLEEIAKSLDKLLEQNTVVTLVGLEGQFYINNVRIRSASESSQQIFTEFFRTMQRLKMGGISFSFPLTPEEWSFLVELFAGQGRGAGCRDWKSIGTELNAHGLNRYVEVFGPLRTLLSGERQRRGVRPLSEIFIEGCDVVEDSWFFAVRGQMPNPQPIRRLIHDLIETLMDGRIRDLSVLAFEDPAEPMKTHWLQVTLLSLLIGHEIGLDAEQLADLGMAAFFHDMGHAVFIDPEIRRGEGWQSLNHQQAGMALVLKHRGFNEGKVKRLLAIQEHHQNATPLAAQPQPVLYSRIVRIADVYDTLCSGLCGGVPLCPTDALERMSSGCPKFFDPVLMQALINRVGHYPPGTIVMLNDDTVAISLGHKADTHTFDRPSLILMRDRRGRQINEQIIDLSQPQYERSKIIGIVPHDPWLEPKKRVIRRLWPRIAEVLEAKAAALAAQQQKTSA